MKDTKNVVKVAATTLSALLLIQPQKSIADSSLYPSPPKAADRPLVYSVEMSDPPSLQPRTKSGEKGTINRFADADIVLLGEHHNSKEDHELQADIVARMLVAIKQKKKELVIGLEMVQKGNPAFQEALDVYIKSRNDVSLEVADKAFIIGTDWGNRWVWDFEVYKPIFHLAREKGIPLVALNVLSETQESVKASGLDGLSDIEREIYVPDPQGFITSVKAPGFQRYTEKVITPSYQFHAENGLLGANPSLPKFFSSRILWDEGMSSSATTYLNEAKPDTMMVVLTGSDHVKFGYGIRERSLRYLRLFQDRKLAAEKAAAELLNVAVVTDKSSKSDKKTVSNVKDPIVISVMLNPTPTDSMSPTVSLQLCLAYGPFLKDQKPLADFLWFSKSPPVKILTRPKNPINNEGDKPEGESSIIGAFSARKGKVTDIR
jgi:uncharacterized iron-regulated protein